MSDKTDIKAERRQERAVQPTATRAMLRVSLLLLLVATYSALTPMGSRVPTPRLDGRIVGGEPVDILQYPWQLSLQSYGSHFCGASVISCSWALTAAHCIDSDKKLSIRAGTSTRASGGSVHDAAEVLFHENYDANTSDYDIGVIQISGYFSFGKSVQRVGLATTEPAVGTKVTATGWGALSSGGSAPRELQAVTTTIVNRAICDERYEPLGWRVTERMICASEEEGGKDACQGDSGGPLVAGNTQYGVVSWGEGCGSAIYPGVYSNVAALRDWSVGLATTEPAVGTKVTTTGWGTLSSGGSSPEHLQGVTTTIVNRAICDARYDPLGWSVTVRMICASEEEGGKDACQGDSGGPLVAGNTQYGVVSWGEGCGSAIYPGVYSNVAALRDWIKDTTGVS